MPTLIGYARVSTQDQSLDLQVDALKAAGCQVVYTDKTSGAKAHKSRAGFSKAISRARKGDTLVVWKLDRLGRTVSELIQITAVLDRRKINLRDVSGSIDTSTPSGKFYFHIMAAFAEIERSMAIERTIAGLEAARKRGVIFGRPRAVIACRARKVSELLSGGYPVAEVAKSIGVHPSTIYRYITKKKLNDQESNKH
ncbi:DNA-invertase hin [Pseudomonas fluorescens]|uniref:recombinase family protein n=1 Tax=Pseudomonas fluorescens TaxID=294 RepID=UPI0012415759|nr:recombinase family protein [Pseudomonas fluorescens]VVN26480.1 DNA-invertase hin [Pseudomonas fluorescens]